MGRFHGIFDRLASGIVIACNVGQAGRQATAPPAAVLFRADNPAPQLDRFLSGERGRKSAVGSIENVVPLVEDDSRRAGIRIAPARRSVGAMCR